MNLGFIGTGQITSSIIYGIFKSKLKVNRIYISSRNKNIAKKLEQRFRSVKILVDNQDIINKSSTIILALTPTVGTKILPMLEFSKDKKIISLISTIKLNKLKKITKNKNVVRAIPLPPIEINKGPVVICPPDKSAKNFFKHLGTVIEVRDEKISYNFWSTSSIMAAYYELLNVSAGWLVKKGVNKNIANKYISELFLSLSQDAVNKRSRGFKKLVAGSQTPKGLNMQALNELKKAKFYNKFIKALENINKRVSK